MPAAAIFVGYLAAETTIVATIGAALVSATGLTVAGAGVAASLAAGTVSAAVATAVGVGAISATVTAVQGGSVSDVLKSAVIGGATSFIGGSLASEVTSGIRASAIMSGELSYGAADAIGKVAGAMANGGVQASLTSVISGKGDPIDALITGGLTAGFTSGAMQGVNALTSSIPGFDKLAENYGPAGSAAQRAINASLVAGVMGKDVDTAVLNSVINGAFSDNKDSINAIFKDLSAPLRDAYDNATKTGEEFDSNVNRQKEIVEEYRTTYDARAGEIKSQQAAIQANLDKHNESVERVAEIDRAIARGDEDYSTLVTVRGQAQQKANDYAALVNAAVPGFNASKAAVEEKLGGLATELDALKEKIPTLQETLTAQKAELDTSLAAFQKQEDVNAQYLTKQVNDAVSVKASIEKATGKPLEQEQLDALIKTGDVTAAAKEYFKQNGLALPEILAEETAKPPELPETSAKVTLPAPPPITDSEAILPQTAAPEVGTPPKSDLSKAPTGETVSDFKNLDTSVPPEKIVDAPDVIPAPQLPVETVASDVSTPQTPTETVASDTSTLPTTSVDSPDYIAPPDSVNTELAQAPTGQTTFNYPDYIAPPDYVKAVLSQAPAGETTSDFPSLTPGEPVSAELSKSASEIPVELAPVGGLAAASEASNVPPVVEQPISGNLPTTGLPIGQTTESLGQTPESLGLVAGDNDKMAKSLGFKSSDFVRPLVATAGNLLRQTLTQPKQAPRPVGGLQMVQAPRKVAPPPRMDVANLIPVQKAAAPPQTLPSTAKLTPIRSIAGLSSLLKKTG